MGESHEGVNGVAACTGCGKHNRWASQAEVQWHVSDTCYGDPSYSMVKLIEAQSLRWLSFKEPAARLQVANCSAGAVPVVPAFNCPGFVPS
jgi:hypothetical protein